MKQARLPLREGVVLELQVDESDGHVWINELVSGVRRPFSMSGRKGYLLGKWLMENCDPEATTDRVEDLSKKWRKKK